jgi:hypothetical protein
MTALARAGRTAVSPSRLAHSAPPLRGFGLDRLPPARRGLAKRSKFDVSASAAFTTNFPEGTGALSNRSRSFGCERSGAILRRCPDRAPASVFCPTIFTSSRSLGRASAGRRSMIFQPGPSRTIGPTLCRSPTPSSTCSRHGSAISSMSCSGLADDLRGQSR